jgi:hypothetical protein
VDCSQLGAELRAARENDEPRAVEELCALSSIRGRGGDRAFIKLYADSGAAAKPIIADRLRKTACAARRSNGLPVSVKDLCRRRPAM